MEIYTASQAIHNVDQLDQVDSDSNSHQVYLSSSLQRTVSANNDLQPPVLNEKINSTQITSHETKKKKEKRNKVWIEEKEKSNKIK